MGVWDDVSAVRPLGCLRATADDGGAVEGVATTEVVPPEETLAEVEAVEVDLTEEEATEPDEDIPRRIPTKRGRGIPLEDLVIDEVYDGTVVGVTGFGAFVNIGAEKDCLVHISQLSQDFIDNPGEVVFKGMAVQVLVLGVDLDAGRIKGSFKHPGMNLRSPKNRWDEE